MNSTVIFIDIDGVLNSKKTRYRHSGALGIDSANLECLCKLVDFCEAELVLISGWKAEWDKTEKDNSTKHTHYGQYIDWKFAKHGLMIADKTQGAGYHMRSDGIRQYVKEHNVDFFLILDDEEEPEYYSPDLFCSWIKTDYRTGLTEQDVLKAVNLMIAKKKAYEKQQNSNYCQHIRFVMGPACSGKSTFIKNTFPDSTVIDLYDIQQQVRKKQGMTIEGILQSYEDTKDALVEAIKQGKDVVLEHTLLLQQRRPMYIDAVRSVTDAPIDIYVLKPDLKTFIEFRKLRDCSGGEKEELRFLEMPTTEEGFSHVYLIEPKYDSKK